MTQFALSIEQINSILQEHFPQVADQISFDALNQDSAIIRLHTDTKHLRPGGTVSGPSMFLLGDVAAYMTILAHAGPKLAAVTSSANIDFLSKPQAYVDVLAHTRILKLGRQLVVVEVLLYSEGQDKMIARSSFTYSLPPATA